MSGRLSLADLRRRRALAGTEDDNVPLVPSPTNPISPRDAAAAAAGAASASAPRQQPAAATTTDTAASGKTAQSPVPAMGVEQKSMLDHLDDYLTSGALFPVNYKEDKRKEMAGRGYGTAWFEALSNEEREELHEASIVRMHSLMNPNRRPSRFYTTPEGKRKKTIEVDYLREKSGILQAIRRSGEARAYGWYALYTTMGRLWMSSFLLLTDIIMDPTNALFECLWGGEYMQCGPQREGSTYALWVYICNSCFGWLVSLVCTYLLPQLDERFNTFHYRITQRAMLFLIVSSSLTLAFEYFTYGGSTLRRAYEVVNIILSIAAYVFCRLTTYITAHETAALSEAVKSQAEHNRRFKEMLEAEAKMQEDARALVEARKEREKNWQPQAQPALAVVAEYPKKKKAQ